MKFSISSFGIFLSLLISAQSFAGPLVSVGGRNSARGLFIEFGSIGGGIDQAALSQYTALVTQLNEQGVISKEIYEQKGREGEVSTCIELDATYATQVISALAPGLLADRAKLQFARTWVYAGQNCDDIRAASEQNLEAYLD